LAHIQEGKLHLPVPAMILAGPVYRGEMSVMTILFLTTVVLSGPAWCSHICYFGGMDNHFASRKKPGRQQLKNKRRIKHTVLFLIIVAALFLKWFHSP